MNILNKDNLEEFLTYYHDFHDSFITEVKYDVSKHKMEVIVDVYWSGNPTLKEDGSYETNKTKMKMVFNKVDSCNIKEMGLDISCAYIKYITIDNRELICFADDEDKPDFYVVCKSIEYEEVR